MNKNIPPHGQDNGDDDILMEFAAEWMSTENNNSIPEPYPLNSQQDEMSPEHARFLQEALGRTGPGNGFEVGDQPMTMHQKPRQIRDFDQSVSRQLVERFGSDARRSGHFLTQDVPPVASAATAAPSAHSTAGGHSSSGMRSNDTARSIQTLSLDFDSTGSVEIVPTPDEVATYPNDQPLVPNRFDVLIGKGAPIRDYPGNKRMRSIIEEYADRYINARKKEKGPIVEEIIGTIETVRERDENGHVHMYRGRFLKALDNGGGYFLADPDAIKEKVRRSMSDYLRHRKQMTSGDNKQAPAAKRKRDDHDDGPGRQGHTTSAHYNAQLPPVKEGAHYIPPQYAHVSASSQEPVHVVSDTGVLPKKSTYSSSVDVESQRPNIVQSSDDNNDDARYRKETPRNEKQNEKEETVPHIVGDDDGDDNYGNGDGNDNDDDKNDDKTDDLITYGVAKLLAELQSELKNTRLLVLVLFATLFAVSIGLFLAILLLDDRN